MGNCNSETATQKQLRRDQKAKSVEIDSKLEEDIRDRRKTSSMLLLGLKNNGSEIVWREAVKQSARDTTEHVELIRTNILVWMRDLIVACETLGIEFEAAENVSIAQEVKSQRFQRCRWEFFDEDTVEKIQSLWRDGGIREALRGSGLPEPEKVKYFMDNVDRFVMRRDDRIIDYGNEIVWSSSVELREEDIVTLYIAGPSSPLREVRYSVAFTPIRVIDASDFLLKGDKFRCYFDCCDLILFCAALDQFDDDSSSSDDGDNGSLSNSGLCQSLRYFEHLLKWPIYDCTFIVLLFKKETFESKFERSENGLSGFQSAFPDYPGSPLASDAIQFI